MDIPVHFAARAIDTVRRVAAREILPRYRNVAAMEKDDGSTVTEADLASQEALCAGLCALEPVPIIAEEMPGHEQLAAWRSSGRVWCIDPLDGTRNFAAAIPFFAISVALMEEGRSVLGIVYDPIADEAFHAVRGAGSWLNHRPLRVPARAPRLSAAVAEVSLRRNTARLRGKLKHRRPYARRITSGSSALSWCHLAAARVDVMLHLGQKMWDYAAGALVLEEAHGGASTLEHDDFWQSDPWSRSVVAARSQGLLVEWRGWLRRHLDGDQPTTQRT